MPTYRGLLHIHSTFSDGELSLPQIRDRATAAGLSFAVICDHAQYFSREKIAQALDECARLTTKDFLFLFGMEFEGHGRHVLLLGPPQLLLDARRDEVVFSPEAVREKGGLTIWAHPAGTYALSLKEGIATDYDGWEVWNRVANGPVPDLAVLNLLRRLRRKGRPILAFSGADLHYKTQPLDPIIELQAPALTPKAILTALRHGHFKTLSSHLTIDSEGKISPRPYIGAKLYAAARHALLRLRCILALLRYPLVQKWLYILTEKTARTAAHSSETKDIH